MLQGTKVESEVLDPFFPASRAERIISAIELQSSCFQSLASTIEYGRSAGPISAPFLYARAAYVLAVFSVGAVSVPSA